MDRIDKDIVLKVIILIILTTIILYAVILIEFSLNDTFWNNLPDKEYIDYYERLQIKHYEH